MKKKVVTLLLALTMAIMPAIDCMATTANGEEYHVLTSENLMGEEEIRKIEEQKAFILKMKEEYENNPTRLLPSALKEEELTKEELTSCENYEEQLWEEINNEVEKRSETKKGIKTNSKEKKLKKNKKSSYKNVLHPSKKNLTSKEKKKVKKVKQKSIDSGLEAAEAINQLEGDTFYAAVRDVLDGYYADEENIEEEKIAEFAETIDDEAEEVLEGYEEALVERQNADTLDYETEHIIVTFEEGTPFTEMQEIAEYMGGEVNVLDGTNKDLSDYMAEGTSLPDEKLIVEMGIGIGQTVERAKEKLETIEGVYGADENAYVEVDSVSVSSTNDIYNTQSYFSQINVNEAWNVIANSLGHCDYENNHAKIAVIDNGFDVEHAELRGVLSEDSIAFSENGEREPLLNCSKPYLEGFNSYYHGSHVAGIIGAESNNGIGTVGITNIYDVDNNKRFQTCEILAIHAGIEYEYVNTNGVTVKEARLGMTKILDGIEYAIKKEVDVLSMSFGRYNRYQAEETALNKAHDAGIVIVASAGNDAIDTARYPASYDGVISVAWLDIDGKTRYEYTDENGKTSGSNYGANIDIAAPGTDIYSCGAGNGSIICTGGTSMAVPMVAAAAGMMRAVNKELTSDEIESILYATATDLYTSGWDENTGHGRLNLGKAVQQARDLKFAETCAQTEFSGSCYKTNLGNDIYASFDINPVVDTYLIYRASSPYELGKLYVELDRKYILSNTNKIQFADWILPQGTYYYNVMGRIYDGDNVISTRWVIGQYVNNPFKVECDMRSVMLQKYSSKKNSLNIIYSGARDKFVIKRGTDEAITQNVSNISSAWNYVTIPYGRVGEQHYYKAQAVKTEEHMTYYSDYSNTISMVFE